MYGTKRIRGFLHYRTDLGDGVRTGVVFSDCSEECGAVCETFRFLPEHDFSEDTLEKSEYTSSELIAYLLEEKTMYYAKPIGITFLGKEPLRDPFFCREVALGLKQVGIGLQIYTCGMCSMTSFECLDGLVETYVLRVFLSSFFSSENSVFHRGEQVRRAIDYLERRGTPYRICLPISSSCTVESAEAFSDYLLTLSGVKSVILDFSVQPLASDLKDALKSVFLKKRIPLY